MFDLEHPGYCRGSSIVFRDARLPEAFWSKIEVLPSGCWMWIAGRDGHGYGMFCVGSTSSGTKRNVGAHRHAYLTLVGPIAEGLHLDHYRYPEQGCVGPTCVFPGHVRPVTPRENVLRGSGPSAECARKTLCSRGHVLPEHRDRRGQRRCSICSTEHARASRDRALGRWR